MSSLEEYAWFNETLSTSRISSKKVCRALQSASDTPTFGSLIATRANASALPPYCIQAIDTQMANISSTFDDNFELALGCSLTSSNCIKAAVDATSLPIDLSDAYTSGIGTVCKDGSVESQIIERGGFLDALPKFVSLMI